MRAPELYLRDIIEAAEAIERFIAGLNKSEFKQDELRQSAVLQKLTIIGEAVNHLPTTLRDQHPDIPWSAIIGFRNVIVHAYFLLYLNIIWDTATTDVPLLKAKVAQILADGLEGHNE